MEQAQRLRNRRRKRNEPQQGDCSPANTASSRSKSMKAAGDRRLAGGAARKKPQTARLTHRYAGGGEYSISARRHWASPAIRYLPQTKRASGFQGTAKTSGRSGLAWIGAARYTARPHGRMPGRSTDWRHHRPTVGPSGLT